MLGGAAPAAVGYPAVLRYGRCGDLTWSLTHRLTGSTLRDAWPGLTNRQRDQAGEQVADRLRALHAWRPPADVTARLLSRRAPETPGSVIGTTINPLPVERVLLIAPATIRRWGVARRAVDWLVDHPDLAPAYDSPAEPITHGDLHLNNVWWDGERVAGLLDLEMARFAPAYVDLARIRDSLECGTTRDAHRQLYERVTTVYPELLVPQLPDRLRYVQLAFELRQLLIWPDGAPEVPDHPAVRLGQLLEGQSS